ncbi:hypothetical protein D3C72_1686350 [compost metagenome]
MCGEAADIENLFAGLRMRAHDRMLDLRIRGGEPFALFRGHRRTERMFDAALCPQSGDALLHVLGQALIGLDHVHPDGVAPFLRAFNAT